VLFIGDSITHAHRRPEEVHDCYSLGCGYVKMVAATLNADHPQLRLRFSNRGECGHRTNELLERWDRDCIALRPDVVSILIGINDANPTGGTKGEPRHVLERYRRLIDMTTTQLPGVRLVVVEPFGLAVAAGSAPVPTIDPQQLSRVRMYQPPIREMASEVGAVFVPVQSAFDQAVSATPASHWALDGVHPSAAGHLLIARQWLAQITGQRS
jgi:lysophospholipase L1-like esterase